MYTIAQAARAFNRVYAPIAEARSIIEEADAGFDGGEFSGGFHAAASEDEFHRCLERVAARFGIHSHALCIAVCYSHDAAQEWLDRREGRRSYE